MNNIGGAVSDKFAFQQKHKFSIAFENTSYCGYCTEKIVEAFVAGTIPIYWEIQEWQKILMRMLLLIAIIMRH